MSVGSASMGALHGTPMVSSSSALASLREEMAGNGGVPMKDKKMLKALGLGYRVYKSCFQGSDAVSWVMSHSPQHQTRTLANRLLQGWLVEGHIRPVGKDSDQFEDDKGAFYRFVAPGEEGVGVGAGSGGNSSGSGSGVGGGDSGVGGDGKKKVKKAKLRVRAGRDQPSYEQFTDAAMMEFLSTHLFLPHQWIPSCLLKTSVARSKMMGSHTRPRDNHFVVLCSRGTGGSAEWSLQLGRYKENKAEYQLINVWSLRNLVAFDKAPGGFSVSLRRKETSEGSSVHYLFTCSNAGVMLQALARACDAGHFSAKTSVTAVNPYFATATSNNSSSNNNSSSSGGTTTAAGRSRSDSPPPSATEAVFEVSLESIDSQGSLQLSVEDAEAQKLMWSWMKSHGITSATSAHEALEEELRVLERGLMHQLMALDQDLQGLHQEVGGVVGTVESVLRWIDEAAPLIREGEGHIRDIRGHKARREREQRHTHDLMETLQVLINSLSVPPRLLSILRDPSFGQDDVTDMVSALHAVDRVITLRDLDQRLLEMRAVADRSAEYRKSIESFGQRLLEHCHSLLSDRASARAALSCTSPPTALHLHLGPFVPVFRALPRAVIPPLMEDYMGVCKPVYERDFKQYCGFLLNGVRKKEHSSVEGFAVALEAVSGLLSAERSFWTDFEGEPGKASSSSTLLVSNMFEQSISQILIALCDDLASFLDYSSRHASGEAFGHQSICVEWQAKNKSQVTDGIATALNNVALQVVNRYTSDAIERMRESHMTRSRTGPLQSFTRLPEILDDVHAFGVTPLTASVSEKIMSAMLEWLESPEVVKELIKFDSSKQTVFAGRLENYYFLHAVLLRYEAKCDYLGPWVKLCMERYQQNLLAFISFVYEGIFESLHDYFSSVSKLMKTVPAEEIQFQASLSRSALQALNRKYSAAVWEKKVMKLRKTVLKTISTNMVDHMWVSVREFLKDKLNLYNDIISQCYGDASVSIRLEDLSKLFEKAGGVKV